MTESQSRVTVSRLTEESICELDKHIGLLWQEGTNDEVFSDDLMNIFNLLLIGYEGAWDEVERLTARMERNDFKLRLAEAQQTIASQEDTIKMLINQVTDEVSISAKAIVEQDRLRKALEESQQVNIVIKEALGSIWANSDDQGAIDCAADALDTVKLIGKLKVGEKVVQKSTGTQGVLIDIQYEHNRYQFADISGWMYYIADLSLVEEVES